MNKTMLNLENLLKSTAQVFLGSSGIAVVLSALLGQGPAYIAFVG